MTLSALHRMPLVPAVRDSLAWAGWGWWRAEDAADARARRGGTP